MNNFEFLSYEPVSGEKFLGIATIRAWNKIILKYKIIATKDGASIFPSTSSIKNGDKYEPAFMLDSNFENKILIDLIKNKVGDCMLDAPKASAPKPSLVQDDECPF